MRKALIPMMVSLALCGAATTALIISTARAQPEINSHKPMLVAANSDLPNVQLAANDAPPDAPPPPRGLRQRDPAEMAARIKQMCQDGYAREAGDLTYIETRLSLTPAEQPLFARWKEAKLAIARRHADKCAERPVPERQAKAQGETPQQRMADRPGPDDMMAREEDRLKERLADIEAERPALGAFYKVLSPEQKMELIHAGMRGDEHGMMHRPMCADAMGPHGPMGGPPGMMGPPGAPPMAPPPPAP
jgi:hypothetical protein